MKSRNKTREKWDDYPDTTIRMPLAVKDDFLEFPFERISGVTETATSDFLNSAYSGLVQHRFDTSCLPISDKADIAKGFVAQDIEVFEEDSWCFECFSVMSRHGWLDKKGELSNGIVKRLIDVDGTAVINEAKTLYGENWEAYVAEIAALHFVRPLSRLWYAVNMQSLYYCHRDDLRLGYLWAEYQFRMRYETEALRGIATTQAARAGGRASGSEWKNTTARIVAEMTRLIGQGHNVSRSAELAYRSGVGTSAEANRKTFQRAKQKSEK